MEERCGRRRRRVCGEVKKRCGVVRDRGEMW